MSDIEERRWEGGGLEKLSGKKATGKTYGYTEEDISEALRTKH